MAWWILYFLCIRQFQLEFGTVVVSEVQDPPYSVIAVSVVSNHPSLPLEISFLIFHFVLHCRIYLYCVEYIYKYPVLGHSMLLANTLCWQFIPVSVVISSTEELSMVGSFSGSNIVVQSVWKCTTYFPYEWNFTFEAEGCWVLLIEGRRCLALECSPRVLPSGIALGYFPR